MVRDVSWKPLFYSPIISKSAYFARKLALLIILNFFFCLLAKFFVLLPPDQRDTSMYPGEGTRFSPTNNSRAFLLPNTLYMAAGGFRDNYTLYQECKYLLIQTGTDSRHPFSPKGQAAKEY